MTDNRSVRTRQPVLALSAAVTAIVLLTGGAPADAAERDGLRLAQRQQDQVTPLRFLTPGEERCQEACTQRAQQCHARAPSLRSKEACENQGITCQEDCLKPRR